MHRLPTIYVHYAAEEHCDSACSILISSSKGGPYTWPSSESSMAVLQIGCTMIGSLPDSFSSRPSCAYSLYCMLLTEMIAMRTVSVFPTTPGSKGRAMLCCVAQPAGRSWPSNGRTGKSFPSLLQSGTHLAGRLLHSRQRSSNSPWRFLPALKHSFWCACMRWHGTQPNSGWVPNKD